MKMMSILQLPFPKDLFKARKYTLPEALVLEQWIIPRGTTITLGTTRNFGIVAIPESTRDIRGFIVPKRLFRY